MKHSENQDLLVLLKQSGPQTQSMYYSLQNITKDSTCKMYGFYCYSLGVMTSVKIWSFWQLCLPRPAAPITLLQHWQEMTGYIAWGHLAMLNPFSGAVSFTGAQAVPPPPSTPPIIHVCITPNQEIGIGFYQSHPHPIWLTHSGYCQCHPPSLEVLGF